MSKKMITVCIVGHPAYFWPFSASLPNVEAHIIKEVTAWFDGDPTLPDLIRIEGLSLPWEGTYVGSLQDFKARSSEEPDIQQA
jgi:hypothetical protein